MHTRKETYPSARIDQMSKRSMGGSKTKKSSTMPIMIIRVFGMKSK